MMRHSFTLLFFLFVQFKLIGQVPIFTHNYKLQDTVDILPVYSLINDYEFSLTYLDDAYYLSGNKDYKVLAFRNNKWIALSFPYYKDQNNDTLIKKEPKKLQGKYYIENENLKIEDVNSLLDFFSANSFWTLNEDSLSKIEKARIYDATNFRFNAFTPTKQRVIQSYAPDFYVSQSKGMADRRKFILCRDEFLKWWQKYCR